MPAPHAIAVIPARYDSVRFPGKVLANATGKPLIQHVWERARLAKSVSRIIVAGDDQRIAEAVEAFGGEYVLTSRDHPNGTSRIAEVARSIDAAYIINIQGDEPEIDPEVIDAAVEALHVDSGAAVSTIASPIVDDDERDNAAVVKVVMTAAGRALYFSRAAIPICRDNDAAEDVAYYRHVGIYVYRREFLLKYVTLAPTPLERAEKLEQLRILEHGYDITVRVMPSTGTGIDTERQYDEFVRRHQSGRRGG